MLGCLIVVSEGALLELLLAINEQVRLIDGLHMVIPRAGCGVSYHLVTCETQKQQ